jgi:hypothetical protein
MLALALEGANVSNNMKQTERNAKVIRNVPVPEKIKRGPLSNHVYKHCNKISVSF